MLRIVAIAAGLSLLVACSQNPFTPPLNPVGSWSGTWTGAVKDTSLAAIITRTSSGWQSIFRTNNADIVTICSNPDDEGPNYLYCGAWSGAEIIVWEGDVIGATWSGVWTYISGSQNLGGSFTLHRN